MRTLLVSARLAALFTFFFFAIGTLSAQDAFEDTANEAIDSSFLDASSPLTDDLILLRLRELDNNCVAPRVTGVVRGYINGYVRNKTGRSRTMLGRRLTYFPLFEQKFKEHNVPSDLKYLSVVESALNPKAVSRVGATGLWQFMPATGKEYNLQQTSTIEERSNAVKSTDAAAQYLKKLYNLYGDWALALAAYNSGPGRVNAAIKRAHSNNFWVIQRYLPEETRNYVPAFIAATYICNYYYLHGMETDIPDFDEQITAHILVFEALSFKDIADATGVDIEVIRNLNAGFKREYLPASPEGHYIMLPQRVMPAFVNYLNQQGSSHKYIVDENLRFIGNDYGDGKYAYTTITTNQDEKIDKIAAKYGCNTEQLRTWNFLSGNWVPAGTKLKIWRPIRTLKHDNTRVSAPASAPAAAPAKASPHKPNTPPATQQANTQPVQAPSSPIWHTVQRSETLGDIARQYSVPEEQIRALNKFGTLKVGMRLKIKN